MTPYQILNKKIDKAVNDYMGSSDDISYAILILEAKLSLLKFIKETSDMKLKNSGD